MFCWLNARNNKHILRMDFGQGNIWEWNVQTRTPSAGVAITNFKAYALFIVSFSLILKICIVNIHLRYPSKVEVLLNTVMKSRRSEKCQSVSSRQTFLILQLLRMKLHARVWAMVAEHVTCAVGKKTIWKMSISRNITRLIFYGLGARISKRFCHRTT